MRRRALTAVLAGAVGAVAIFGVVRAAGDDGPAVAAPRVCWQNDYRNELPTLSNMCEYRPDEKRWYLEADGRERPASEVSLGVANLCLYFWGPRCPTEEEKRRGLSYVEAENAKS